MTLAHRMVEDFFLSLFPKCLFYFLIMFSLSLLFCSSLSSSFSFFSSSFFPFNLDWRLRKAMTPIPFCQGWQDEWQQVKHIDLPVLLKPHTGWTSRQYMLTTPSKPVVLSKHVCLFVPLLTQSIQRSFSRVSWLKRFWFGVPFCFFVLSRSIVLKRRRRISAKLQIKPLPSTCTNSTTSKRKNMYWF